MIPNKILKKNPKNNDNPNIFLYDLLFTRYYDIINLNI